MKKKVLFGFMVDPDLRDKALEKARSVDQSLSRVLRELLREWLEEGSDAAPTMPDSNQIPRAV